MSKSGTWDCFPEREKHWECKNNWWTEDSTIAKRTRNWKIKDTAKDEREIQKQHYNIGWDVKQLEVFIR